MEQIQKKGNYLLAYIDIIAYSNMIKNDDINIYNIIDFNDKQQRFFNGDKRYGSISLEIIGFSDSLELTIEISKEIDSDKNDIFYRKVEYLLKKCIYIQLSLIKKGILSRGGITYDEHMIFKDKNITYFLSKAHVNAVELEKKTKYPIILIHDNLLNKLNNEFDKYSLLKDELNNYFLDFLKNINHEEKTIISRFINRNIFKYFDNNEYLYLKYQWLNNYLNYSFSESFNNVDNLKDIIK